MSDQYSDLEVETFARTDMRDIVASKVKNLRKQFKLIPIKFERFNIRLAAHLKEEWDRENKEYVKKNKSEKPLVRLERWKSMSKSYRSKGIAQLSENWYESFWRLRSDMALIVALYEFSEIEQISRRKGELKTKAVRDLKPIALRMKGPRKPTKKKILIRDLYYNIEDAFLTMVRELEIKTIETRDLIKKLVAPTKKLPIKTKIKRFQDAVLTREYLTLITQAVAPRQGIQDSEYTNNSTN